MEFKKPNTFYKLVHKQFVFYPTVQNLHAGNITQTTRYMNAPEAKACRFIRELRKEGKKSYFAQA